MILKFSRFNFPLALLAGTTTIAAIVIIQPTALAEKSAEEIAQYATAITVQVNRPRDVMGAAADGTGFIIKKEGTTYVVLTCMHVVRPPQEDNVPPQNYPNRVRTGDGAEYPITNVQPLGTDKDTDLALLTFNSPNNYPVATLVSPSQANLGKPIYVFGYPVNGPLNRVAENRVADFQAGYIWQQTGNNWKPSGYTMFYTAQTLPGMSGGPVFDSEGRVIGVHGFADQFRMQPQSGSGNELPSSRKSGINSAVPIDTFVAIAQQKGVGGLAIERAATGNPQPGGQNSPSVSDWIGQALSQPSNKTGTLNAFNQALALQPNSSILYYNRGNTRYDMGDKQGAIADYTEAIRLNPNNANAYYNRAVARNNLGDKQGAVADLTVALQFDPSDILAYNSRGKVLRALGDGHGAFADFDQVVRLAPYLSQAYYNRGLARAMFNDRPGVIADFTQAIALNPRFTVAYINRALSLRLMGQLQAAIQDLNAVLSYEPNNGTAIYNRGLFRRDLEDRQGAFEDLQRAAAIFQQAGDTRSYSKAIDAIQRLQSTPVTPPASQPNYVQPNLQPAPNGIHRRI